MADFTREHDRYVVLKRTDLEAHTNVADLVTLGRICADINTGRAARLAQPLRAVVVESDWPEYEPTWRAIEARMRSLNEPSGDSGQLPALAQQAGPVEMSPEFTDTARAAIAWVLYHHQGGSSPIGQPLRMALGMGQHESLPDWRIAEAKRYAAMAGAETADFHRGRAPQLWCLHLVGPDDVHPAPSKAHAELAAKRLNDWFAERPKTEHTPHFEAVSAPWPHSAESHAAGVEQFIPEFLLPASQTEVKR